MQGFLSDFINRISGEWRLNLETQVPREELYRIRIASSKPSLGFFRTADLFSSNCDPWSAL